VRGGWGSFLFVPDTALGLGGLKGQDTHGWFLTTRVFRHLLCPQHLETSQGVSVDSLGVGAIEIRRIFVPDHRQHRQGSAEACSGDAGGVFAFFHPFSGVCGGLGSPLFVPGPALWLGGLKRQDTHRWFLTTCVFWHFLCLWCNGSHWAASGGDKRAWR